MEIKDKAEDRIIDLFHEEDKPSIFRGEGMVGFKGPKGIVDIETNVIRKTLENMAMPYESGKPSLSLSIEGGNINPKFENFYMNLGKNVEIRPPRDRFESNVVDFLLTIGYRF
tara:strand:- start:148 stop:486 length:339 start_codon:yes stop_codon:yes gene_type:complete